MNVVIEFPVRTRIKEEAQTVHCELMALLARAANYFESNPSAGAKDPTTAAVGMRLTCVLLELAGIANCARDYYEGDGYAPKGMLKLLRASQLRSIGGSLEGVPLGLADLCRAAEKFVGPVTALRVRLIAIVERELAAAEGAAS